MRNLDINQIKEVEKILKESREIRLEQDINDEIIITDDEVIEKIISSIDCSYEKAKSIFKSEF